MQLAVKCSTLNDPGARTGAYPVMALLLEETGKKDTPDHVTAAKDIEPNSKLRLASD